MLATRRQGWRGFVGRTNGGMIVHLGVIVIAVALVTSNAYTRSQTMTLVVGEEQTYGGHTFELEGLRLEEDARVRSVVADVRVDGERVYAPKNTTYLQMGTQVPTPSVRTGVTGDIYLTLGRDADPTATEAAVTVSLKPLVLWLWIGGAIMALGTLLAAFPGRLRRRPTDPTSARVPDAERIGRQPGGDPKELEVV